MKWLHFSDFHFKAVAGPQTEAMDALLDFLRDNLQEAVNAVFLVGDIAHSGCADEYKRFEDSFLKPLRQIEMVQNAKIFAVPGNHDVDCDAASPITWEGIRTRGRENFFLETLEGQTIRQHRAPVFRQYFEFVTRNGINSPNPMIEVSKFFASEADFDVDVLAVNTSFFSDRDEHSSEPITPSPLSSIRNRLANLSRSRPLLVLGHHPITCLRSDQQTPFETFLLDKAAIYLCGHEHAARLTTNANGTTRSIGFGATYTASLGSTQKAAYRNSFAICSTHDHLYLNSFSWDPDTGRWTDSTQTQFSAAMTEETFVGNSVRLAMPQPVGKASRKTLEVPLDRLPRRIPAIQGLARLALPSERVWLRILAMSENVNSFYRDIPDPDISQQSNTDGKNEFILEDGEKRDLLVCIPGSSHVLSAKEVESYNTRLDTDDLRSATIVSFGKISNEARQMYVRLRTRKSIEILLNQELAAKSTILLSNAQNDYLSQCDSGKHSAELLIDYDLIYLLILQTNPEASFQIIDPSGAVLVATHDLVTKLREGNPLFAKMNYLGSSDSIFSAPAEPQFDEMDYLKKVHAESNVLKYAALANVGMRFSELSLDGLYIDASATEVAHSNADRLDALLDDHLVVYEASDKLKEQIKRQFLADGNPDRHETSQAREFCQKYGAVLLTGDPGSGKTCFVKSEMLAYSKRSIAAENRGSVPLDDWHAFHVPVLVQLSQAAAEPDLQSKGLISIASRLLERRGISFPADRMEDLRKQGRLALFFDGLDEIVSVEKRAVVVQLINQIVTDSLSLSNRIVVTSRPAAVNVINLLPVLRKLELQGLTETEISLLASRIISHKLSDTGEGIRLHTKQVDIVDSSIVRQILQDCREKPGVARLAQNPLLLTLLVMIYANSGAPSAKRHLIYEEAIKTLASVRGRQAGHTPVSVQDLRERLGAVALSVYRKESGFLPTRAEVTAVVRGVMARQRGGALVSTAEADQFIQKVAESTGLIALGGNEYSTDVPAIVTFMHHSFMEYFAAVGLSRELDKVDVVSLLAQPRWIEILTLLAGIIGENEDIAPILSKFIGDGSGYGEIDAKFLTFALDCAAECEVPSEAAVRLLSTCVVRCVSQGPGRADPWVRAEIGQRVAQLIVACGLSAFEPMLIELISFDDGDQAAAGISLAGYACTGESDSQEIVKAIDRACTRAEEGVLSSVCEAAARVKWFRTPLVLQTLQKCLRKSIRCRCAALEAVIHIPGMAATNWDEIIKDLDSKYAVVRRLASKAAIQAGLDGNLAALNDIKKDIVASAFRVIYESSSEGEDPTGRIKQEIVDRLLISPSIRDRVIGIQLIPIADAGAEYAHKKLMDIIRNSADRQEVVAALRTFRSSREAQMLATTGDLRRITKHIVEGTEDVRIAATYLTSIFSEDSNTIRILLERNLSELGSSELSAIFFALGRADILQDEVVRLIEQELNGRLIPSVKMNKGYNEEVCAILAAAQHLAHTLDSRVVANVWRVAKDFRYDETVRGAAICAYPAIAEPSKYVAETLAELLKSPPPKLLRNVVETPKILADKCRQNVAYVISCVERMSALRAAAIELHGRLLKRGWSGESDVTVSTLRNGIHELTRIMVTFEEFIQPAHERNAGGSMAAQ